MSYIKYPGKFYTQRLIKKNIATQVIVGLYMIVIALSLYILIFYKG